MKSYILLILLCISLFSCDYYVINSHDNNVGAISENSKWDSSDFKPCFEERMFPAYYGTKKAGYLHGKDSLRTYFLSQFENNGYKTESGYITIRFIINCEGEAGRYEVLETGTDYKTKKFDPYLSEHLMTLAQKLKGWIALEYDGAPYDSFFHLTFKIEHGEIVEILP